MLWPCKHGYPLGLAYLLGNSAPASFLCLQQKRPGEEVPKDRAPKKAALGSGSGSGSGSSGTTGPTQAGRKPSSTGTTRDAATGGRGGSAARAGPSSGSGSAEAEPEGLEAFLRSKDFEDAVLDDLMVSPRGDVPVSCACVTGVVPM
jgi:hypothetical protein